MALSLLKNKITFFRFQSCLMNRDYSFQWKVTVNSTRHFAKFQGKNNQILELVVSAIKYDLFTYIIYPTETHTLWNLLS